MKSISIYYHQVMWFTMFILLATMLKKIAGVTPMFQVIWMIFNVIFLISRNLPDYLPITSHM